MPQQKALTKNVNLGYLLTFLHNSFFWYAPWLLFLLKHITFEQAAILQSVGLLTTAVLEVPTGALSDLIGKKKTLHLAFLFSGIAEIYMAFATEFHQFAMQYVVVFIGYSFYSGTMEAFMYDTLASHKKENTFKRILSRSSAIKNTALVVSSIVGGYLFGFWIGLPFFLTGVAKIAGFFVSFFIDEPNVDTDTFSLQNYLKQTKKGFSQLFSKKLASFSILLLTFTAFNVPVYEILDDIVVIDYGYSAESIGLLYAGAILLSIPSGLMYEKVSSILKPLYLVLIGMVILVVNYALNPVVGVVIWTSIFLVRVIFSALRDNAVSDILNANTQSKVRATTLSTFSMLSILPFVFASPFIASAAESIGLRNFNALFIGVFFVLAVPQVLNLIYKNAAGELSAG